MVLSKIGFLQVNSPSGKPRILDEAILGDPEAAAIANGLHAQAWAGLKAFRRRELEDALRAYREPPAGAGTAAAIADVVACARAGSVRHLFVRRGHAEWGHVDSGSGGVALHPVPSPVSENLADRACLDTLLHGGRVHVLAAEDMPAPAGIAALYRR